MTYFVTGATGFIGRRLVKKLLARRGTTVYFLVRPEADQHFPFPVELGSQGYGARVKQILPQFHEHKRLAFHVLNR